jgi:competence protein ComEC
VAGHEIAADFRLAVPAAALWAGAWWSPLIPPMWALAGAALLVTSVLLLRRFPWWVSTAALLLAVSAASIAVRVTQMDAEPFAAWVTSGRHVLITGVLMDDPTFSDRPGFVGGSGQQVVVHVRVEVAAAGTAELSMRTPVLVVGDASGWQNLHFGDSVEVSGSLHPAAHSEPIGALLFSDDEAESPSPAPRVLRAAESMRSGLRDAVAGLPDDVRGLLPALVVGDTTAMSSLLTSDLKDAGLSHLTAVSGANVAMVVGAVLLAGRLLGARAYWLVALGLTTIVWFVLLARPQPSVLRAAVMGSLALVAVGAAGKAQAVRSMLAAVVLLLLIDPWLARSWGFALSVAATAGLVLLSRRIAARLPQRWPSALREAIAVAVAAQVATLPLVMALSGRVALLSVVANLLAAPAVPIATVLGASAAAVAPVAAPVAALLAWLGQWPTAWIALVARRSASSPLATVPWPDGWYGGLLGTAVIVAVYLVVRFGGRRAWWRPRWLALASIVAAAMLVAYLVGPGRWPPVGWVVVACDVGQGDALALNAGEGTAIVIDAGPDPDLADRCLDRLGVKHVPLLVLTHFHADHLDGVPGVLEGRTVDQVLVSPLHEPQEQVDEVARWTAGLPVTTAEPGQTGSWGAASWQVLWPEQPIEQGADEGSGPNNASVVLVATVNGVRLLLTGDVEPEAQHVLVANGVPPVDVLKVPHHGSKYQDGAFLAAADAEIALVSVGIDNSYGHPDAGVLQALQDSGVVVARTDQQGSVAVVKDGDELRVVSMP